MSFAKNTHGPRRNQKPLVCFLSSSLRLFVLFIKSKIIQFVSATLGIVGVKGHALHWWVLFSLPMDSISQM